ncbi:MAG TPA: CHAT domain-containing protein [Bryobacteraceae bacterium]|nr:CHAT domain-containing protein [Bryobacteraceae bacterium]
MVLHTGRLRNIIASSILVVLAASLVYACNQVAHSRRIRSEDPLLASIRARAFNSYQHGLYSDAVSAYEEGYRRAEALHDRESAARFLSNIGGARFAMLDYPRALDALLRAKTAALALGDTNISLVAHANLCSLYMQLGNLDAARAVAEAGVRLPTGSNLPYRSQFYVTLGILNSQSGSPQRALDYFAEAVRQAEIQGDHRLMLEAWNHYGQELFAAGRLDEAEDAALRIYWLGRFPDCRELRPAYLLLARIARKRGDFDQAASYAGRGLDLVSQRPDNRLWEAYFRLERGAVRRCFPDLEKALTVAREWRDSIGPSEWLSNYASHWIGEIYDAYVDAAVSGPMARPAEAFLAIEEERASTLVRTLESSSTWRQSLPAGYWRTLAALRAEMAKSFDHRTTTEHSRVRQLRNRLHEFEAGSGLTLTPFGNKTGEKISSENTLSNIRRSIRADEALISLHLGQRSAFISALTNRRLEMHRLAGSPEITKLAKSFENALEASAPGRDRIGKELYLKLFGQLSPAVRRRAKWILSSDDVLFEVPFSALVVPKKNRRPLYLVELHSTERIPSAFLLATRSGDPQRGRFLGAGDGIYNAADPRSGKFGARNGVRLQLARLAGSGGELQACAAVWKNRAQPVLLTGEQLSREAFERSLRSAPSVIHLAAHVLQQPGHPDEALIHLGFSANGDAQVLTIEDIANLQLPGSLVVMSGCSSAAGGSLRGAGVLGLTRAWLVAGARAVIGSRWATPDDSGEIFQSFYRRLASEPAFDGPAIVRSFHAARIAMLRSRSWRSDPRYWAAFYLIAKD